MPDESDQAPDEPLLEALGIPESFAADDLAPPVDEGVVRAFVRREVSPETAELVADLVATFRPWRVALGDALASELALRPTPAPTELG